MKNKILGILVPFFLAVALLAGFLSLNLITSTAKSKFPLQNPGNAEDNQLNYGEAPILAAQVAAGKLPPVVDRLPAEEDIVVINPVDGIGEYGGTWHNVSWWSGFGNIEMLLYDPPVRWKADYSGYEPGLLKSWDISADGKTLTWNLRRGVKWSDGEPFSSSDLQFWWEDLATNPNVEAVEIPWWGFNSDSTPMTVTFPTSMSMVMNWDRPNFVAPYIVGQGFWEWQPMERPKHFLSPHHPDYNPGATYEELESFLYGDDWLTNVPGYPCLHAWCPANIIPGDFTILVRNPYYWKVDTEGNQLPYIDRIVASLIPDYETRLQNISKGLYEASFRGVDNPLDIPYLQANVELGDYQVWPGAVNGSGAWPGWLVNQNFNDQENYPVSWEVIGDLLRDKNFRQGLSYAINRDAMIQAVWRGNGTAQQATISPQSWHFTSPEGQAVYQDWASSYITYTTIQATALFSAANFIDQDFDGWRDLPDGSAFTLTLDMGDWGTPQIAFSATQELKIQLEEIGIRVAIIDLLGSPDWDLRQVDGLYMLKNCHVSELDIWTYPDWVFPVRDNRAWPLEGKWYQSGGSDGWEPQPGTPAYELQALYAQGLAEPDENLRHAILWDAINIHIQEGPFMIGVSGDQPMPVVIRNGFHGVPDEVILGPWAPGSPGNLHTEQFWMDARLRRSSTIQISAVTPESAILPPEGQLIQIDGNHFTNGMYVILGDHLLPYSNLTYISEQRLEVLVPDSIPPGTYDLIVISPDSFQDAVLLDAFTVSADIPASITSITPKNGLNDTPVTIFIKGANFSPGMSANLQDENTVIPLEGILFIDSRLLRGTISTGTPPGVYDLILTDIYSRSGTLVKAYTSLDPATSDDLFALDQTDLWSDPPSIEAGETVTLGLTIRRQGGTSDLVNVATDFYLDGPEGMLIGGGTADRITPNGTGNATTPWIAPAAGQYTIYAIIDPDDDIIEDPENNIISRTLRVIPAVEVILPPQIDSLTINYGAANSSARQIYLNVSASSGTTTPDNLLYVEYQYIQNRHDWVPVAISGWLPYQKASSDYAWKLQPGPGVHYLQAWAADFNRLVSVKPGKSFINYLPSEAHVATQEVHIYQYSLLTGESLFAQLSSLAGDADLYAWDPSGNDIGRSETSDPVEIVQFTAAMDGLHQVEVEGFTSADFGLEILLSGNMTQNLGIQSPTPRGRGIPLTSTLPDDQIGLPVPPGIMITLPLVVR